MAELDIRDKMDYSENGVLGTAVKNTTTAIDLKVTTEKTYVNGGQLLYKDAAWGDWIVAQVIDKDNVLGYGTNVVLSEYIHKRFIHPDMSSTTLNLPYAGLIPINCYLRIVYNSVSTTTDVQAAINYFFHRVK